MCPLDRIYAFDINGSHKDEIAVRPAVEEDAPVSLWLEPVSLNRNSGGDWRYSIAFDGVFKVTQHSIRCSPRAAKCSFYGLLAAVVVRRR